MTKPYTQQDKRALIYFTSVATPNLRHKAIASKLKRNETAITQKIAKMKASGEYEQLLNAIMQDNWHPAGTAPTVADEEIKNDLVPYYIYVAGFLTGIVVSAVFMAVV